MGEMGRLHPMLGGQFLRIAVATRYRRKLWNVSGVEHRGSLA